MLEELYRTNDIAKAEAMYDKLREKYYPLVVFIFRYRSLDDEVITHILLDRTGYDEEYLEAERLEEQERLEEYQAYMWEKDEEEEEDV